MEFAFADVIDLRKSSASQVHNEAGAIAAEYPGVAIEPVRNLAAELLLFGRQVTALKARYLSDAEPAASRLPGDHGASRTRTALPTDISPWSGGQRAGVLRR